MNEPGPFETTFMILGFSTFLYGFYKFGGKIANYITKGLEKDIGCDEDFDLGPKMNEEIPYEKTPKYKDFFMN